MIIYFFCLTWSENIQIFEKATFLFLMYICNLSYKHSNFPKYCKVGLHKLFLPLQALQKVPLFLRQSLIISCMRRCLSLLMALITYIPSLPNLTVDCGSGCCMFTRLYFPFLQSRARLYFPFPFTVKQGCNTKSSQWNEVKNLYYFQVRHLKAFLWNCLCFLSLRQQSIEEHKALESESNQREGVWGLNDNAEQSTPPSTHIRL